MALRIGQTPLIIEDQFTSGHLRVGQTSLIMESVPPPTGHLRINQGVLILETLAGSFIPSVIGIFQDPLGKPYANGTITFQLSVDAFNNALGVLSAVSSSYVIKGSLDSNGSIIQPLNLWPNAILTPAKTYYKTKVFTSGGQLVWHSPVTISNTFPTSVIGIPQI